MSFVIKHEQFEGPLDLLLTLIEKRKLFVNDISLAKVTDDYVNYLQQNSFTMGDAAGFILIASTLLLIKSKSLLPALTLTEEETNDVSDLQTRLTLYEIYRRASNKIRTMFGKNILFSRNRSKIIDPVFSPDQSMTLKNLHSAALNVLNSLPKKEKLPEIKVKKTMSLEEMIDNLSGRIQSSLRMSFKDFSKTKEKVEVIVGFLALLELVKNGAVQAEQGETFSDIHMESNNIGIPRYNV
ncbi:MAG: segregation/condensation protein A [Candidatus Pacebacteria bacterium]|jgi:segregation and condensation protein A|nr:segregation/condensation protein A [Candidatus Paceibacterota bacterium]